MPKIEYDPKGWHDAGLEVAYWWDKYSMATTVIDQGSALLELINAMSDLKTWLPGWDGNIGEFTWFDSDEWGPDEWRDKPATVNGRSD